MTFLLFKEALHLYPYPIFFITDMSELIVLYSKTIGCKNPLHTMDLTGTRHTMHSHGLMGAASA